MHCLEAALAAAPSCSSSIASSLVLSFESTDLLDHVIFVIGDRTGGDRWRARAIPACTAGSRYSRRRARLRSVISTGIDYTGRIKAYAVVDLRCWTRIRLATR